MRQGRSTAVGIAFFGLFAACLVTAEAAEERAGGGNDSSAVIELAFLDVDPTGQMFESVTLRVTAAGEVLIPGEDGRTLFIADRMQPEQLSGLLRELDQTGRLREIQSEELATEIRRASELAGFAPEIEGAAETIIRLHTPQGRHEVRCTGLSVLAARFPDFPALQRLLATQLRLQNVAAVARAGGEQASQRLVEIANQTLQLERPGLPALTPRDLSMVRELSSGSRYIQFYRRPSNSGEELLVSMFESPGSPPRVSILPRPGDPGR